MILDQKLNFIQVFPEVGITIGGNPAHYTTGYILMDGTRVVNPPTDLKLVKSIVITRSVDKPRLGNAVRPLSFTVWGIECRGEKWTASKATGYFERLQGNLVEMLDEMELFRRDGKILSIKRLSDGEIFSVGEVIFYGSGGNEVCKIDRFAEDLWTWLTSYDHMYPTISSNTDMTIKDWRKAYKVEDGYVSGCHPIYTLNLDNWGIYTHQDKPDNDPRKKYFKQEQSALDYIAKNKPVISLNDIDDLLKASSQCYDELQDCGMTVLNNRDVKNWLNNFRQK